jgi:glycosyltransferase involved in cell wall biosynthesis
LGFINNSVEYLLACDIYLSTSLWEGLPYSLIEAAACGLPIIASDVIGNNEVVIDGENGYLFNLNEPEIAVEKILELVNSEKQIKILRENSFKIVEDKFLLTKMINKMREIYSNT